MRKISLNLNPPCVVWRDDDPERRSFSAILGFIYATPHNREHELVHQRHIWRFVGVTLAFLAGAFAVSSAFGITLWGWLWLALPIGNIGFLVAYQWNVFDFGLWTEAMAEATEVDGGTLGQRWLEFERRWGPISEARRSKARRWVAERYDELNREAL